MSRNANRGPAARLAGIVATLPDEVSVSIPVSTLRAWLEEGDTAPQTHAEAAPASWRVLLWSVPAETRIGVRELCEALDRSPDWLYRHTSPKADERIPHRKLGGELEFVVGEVREWIRHTEDVVVRGATDAPALRVAR